MTAAFINLSGADLSKSPIENASFSRLEEGSPGLVVMDGEVQGSNPATVYWMEEGSPVANLINILNS